MLSIKQRQSFKDIFSVIVFIGAVVIGAWLINSLVFRSFSVLGPSMETTMYTGDRLIINRLPVTFEALKSRDYLPKRGHVIVFKNPNYYSMNSDEYIVKRVIGLPGDRVVIGNGNVTVYNDSHPDGLNPYAESNIPETAVVGEVDQTIRGGEIFVIGDNRSGQESLDSRNGLGTVPLKDIIGPVAFRIFPLDKISSDF